MGFGIYCFGGLGGFPTDRRVGLFEGVPLLGLGGVDLGGVGF